MRMGKKDVEQVQNKERQNSGGKWRSVTLNYSLTAGIFKYRKKK